MLLLELLELIRVPFQLVRLLTYTRPSKLPVFNLSVIIEAFISARKDPCAVLIHKPCRSEVFFPIKVVVGKEETYECHVCQRAFGADELEEVDTSHESTFSG